MKRIVLVLIAAASDSYFVFQLIILVLTGIGAMILVPLTVRRLAQPFTDVEKSAEEEKIEEQAGLVLMRDRFPDNLLAPSRRDDLIPEGTNPVLDKEMRFEIFGRGTLLVRLIIQISIGISIFFIPMVFTELEPIYTAYLLAFIIFITPAFACPAFTQERERGTMDLLLTTLVTPEQIIVGKVVSAVRCTGVLTLFLSLPLLMGIVAKSVTFTELGMHFAVIAVTIFATTVFALFFSLVCPTTLVALVATYLTLLFLYIAPALGYKVLEAFTKTSYESIQWVVVTSPFFAACSIGEWEYAQTFAKGAIAPEMVWGLFNAIYLVLAVALLATMRAGFDRFTSGRRARARLVG